MCSHAEPAEEHKGAVRDDAHLLYGFSTEGERRLFRSLLKVNGVGTKMALVILSGMDANAFAECVHAGDVVRLTVLPGVGKKTAERLIVEMRDRVDDLRSDDARQTPREPSRDKPVNDAISGLIALGYKPAEASKYVHALEVGNMKSEDIIREVLKNLVG